MENVILTIHMILAVLLIGVVLLQRSEGGGLGMGSGSAMSGRSAATALSKMTWIIAAAFLTTSLTLTYIASHNSANESVIDRLGTAVETAPAPAELPEALTGDLTPPDSGPAAPPAVELPATEPAPAT